MWDNRVTPLSSCPSRAGRAVLYWMQRSQRSRSNLALNYAIEQAQDRDLPVLCLFVLDASYPYASERSFAFVLEGLADVRRGLADRRVAFVARAGRTHEVVAEVAREVDAALVVTDESHLRFGRRRRREAAERLERDGIPLVAIDADVLVPVRSLDRAHAAAYTIRPVLRRFRLGAAVTIPDPVARHEPPEVRSTVDMDDVDGVLRMLPLDRSVGRVALRGGEQAGLARLRAFVGTGLPRYHADRNNPALAGTSRLSPYLHFGHLDPWRVVDAVTEGDATQEAKDAFLDELLVRRELADNFTFFTPDYDRYDALPEWARRSLAKHQTDPRPAILSREQLAAAETGDDLWNAAQRELLTTGAIHNYMRMYWGKQVLTWTRTPEEAFDSLIHLNNLYALDGRDPVSYANISWCFGLHDHPWPEHRIFGAVRSMTRDGAERKFKTREYIRRFSEAGAASQQQLL